jgi:hypothetical protein
MISSFSNVELTLYNNIEFDIKKLCDKSREEVIKNGQDAKELFEIILKNIPKNRLKYFFDEKCNVQSTKKSFYDIMFENVKSQNKNKSNKYINNTIFEHPHFIPYLNFFIHGSQLPQNIKQQFKNIYDIGDYNNLHKFVRGTAKKIKSSYDSNSYIAYEFMKLALDLNCDNPRRIYDMVMR